MFPDPTKPTAPAGQPAVPAGQPTAASAADLPTLAHRASDALHRTVDGGREQVRQAAEGLPRVAAAYVSADPLKSLVIATVVGAAAMAVLFRFIR